VEHVVVHLWQYPPDRQADLQARLAATPALTLAHQAGEDYVYALAADPWLRKLAAGEAAPGPVWFSAGVGAAHPEMEVLAYFARYRLGWPGVHGDLPLGYRPLPSLPWGVPADLVIQPPGEPPPFGYQPGKENAFAAIYRRDPALVARYDWLAPNAPACCAVTVAEGAQHVRLLLGATVTTTFVVPLMADSVGRPLNVPPGVSSYVFPELVLPREYGLGAQQPGSARLLAVEAWSAPPGSAGAADRYLAAGDGDRPAAARYGGNRHSHPPRPARAGRRAVHADARRVSEAVGHAPRRALRHVLGARAGGS
jgi:hypothetical protein